MIETKDKKFLDEEILSDEELEKIAGGLLVIANRDKKEPDVNNGHQDKIIHWTA